MTTNADKVWALDALTGRVKWRYTPDNLAVSKNFGIVANRGVPDREGAFSMWLPASIRGKTVRFWENERQFFSRFPRSGRRRSRSGGMRSELGTAYHLVSPGSAIPP